MIIDIKHTALASKKNRIFIMIIRNSSMKISHQFEHDRPICTTNEDILGYSNFAMHVASLLYNRDSSDSFIASINAPWGQGKSSCLNLIQERLKEIDKESIIINFNPWHIPNSQDDLLAQFFLSLTQHIQPFFSRKQSDFKLFSNLLSGFTITCNLHILNIQYDCNKLATALRKTSSLHDIKNKIDSFLLNIKRKIFVFIDDIDRLNSNEVIQIFRLIKAIANFKNITYILAFDLNVVSKILEQEQHSDGKKYLEKIITLQLNLPIPPHDSVENYLIQKIDKLASGISLSQNDRFLWMRIAQELIFKRIKNIRDVNRLYNTILTTYPLIKDNTNLIDFISIEFVQLFYNNIWVMIATNQDLFTVEEAMSEHKSRLQKRFEALINNIQTEKDIAFVVIKNLFPNLGNVIDYKEIKSFHFYSPTLCEKEKRICASDRIHYYFTLNLNEKDISDQEISNLLSSTTARKLNIQFQKYSKTILSNGRTRLSYLLDKLIFYVDDIVKPKFIDVFFECIFSNAQKYNHENDTILNLFPYTNSDRFIRLIIKTLEANLPQNNYLSLLNIAKNPKCIAFACDVFVILGQNFGYFSTSKQINNELFISTSNYKRLAETLTKTIIDNFHTITSVKDAHTALRFVKEFSSLKAQNLLSSLVKPDKIFIDFLNDLYMTSYQTTDEGVKKVKKLELKNIEFWFEINDVIKRLQRIVHNQGNMNRSQQTAQKILNDIVCLVHKK